MRQVDNVYTRGSGRCPVCGAGFAASTGPGRPRIYCGDACRHRARHTADTQAARRLAREQEAEQSAQWAAMSVGDLIGWLDGQQWPDPC